MSNLSKRQMVRQDFVDNQIFELINSLLPPSKQINWNIEIIGAVRDSIQNQVVKENLISEKQFYPYIII